MCQCQGTFTQEAGCLRFQSPPEGTDLGALGFSRSFDETLDVERPAWSLPCSGGTNLPLAVLVSLGRGEGKWVNCSSCQILRCFLQDANNETSQHHQCGPHSIYPLAGRGCSCGGLGQGWNLLLPVILPTCPSPVPSLAGKGQADGEDGQVPAQASPHLKDSGPQRSPQLNIQFITGFSFYVQIKRMCAPALVDRRCVWLPMLLDTLSPHWPTGVGLGIFWDGRSGTETCPGTQMPGGPHDSAPQQLSPPSPRQSPEGCISGLGLRGPRATSQTERVP